MPKAKPLTNRQIINRVAKRVLTTSTPTPSPQPVKAKVKGKGTIKKLALPLSSMASQFRHLRPTWRTYIEYAFLGAKDGDKDMVQYVATYQALSKKEQETHTPEQVCDLSGISQGTLMGAVARMVWTHSRNEAALITAVYHPQVIERTAKSAITPKGIKDREMFHKSTGFLPTPTSSININNNPQTLIGSGISAPVLTLPSVQHDMDEIRELDFLPPLQITGGGGKSGVDSTSAGTGILEGDITDV